MAYTKYYGTVATNGSTKITCTAGTLNIVKIGVSNTVSDFTITAKIFIQKPFSQVDEVPVYTFNLDMGDNLRDSEQYMLNIGDYLQLVTNVANTKYQITAQTL